MSALDDLKNKRLSERTELEEAVLFGFEDWEAGMEVAAQQLADKDAELLALLERVAKLENQLKDAQKVAVYFSKLGHGVRPSLGSMRLVRAYEAALKSQ